LALGCDDQQRPKVYRHIKELWGRLKALREKGCKLRYQAAAHLVDFEFINGGRPRSFTPTFPIAAAYSHPFRAPYNVSSSADAY